MDKGSRLNRLEFLKNKHKHQHKLVETLEGEKAPDEVIAKAKKVKLSIKDEILTLENVLKAEGVEINV